MLHTVALTVLGTSIMKANHDKDVLPGTLSAPTLEELNLRLHAYANSRRADQLRRRPEPATFQSAPSSAHKSSNTQWARVASSVSSATNPARQTRDETSR